MCIYFYFAENLLLPHLLGQPGHLYFVTRLKLDFLAFILATSTTRIYITFPRGVDLVERPQINFPLCFITLLLFPCFLINTLRITRYGIFRFSRAMLESIFVKEFSNCSVWSGMFDYLQLVNLARLHN